MQADSSGAVAARRGARARRGRLRAPRRAARWSPGAEQGRLSGGLGQEQMYATVDRPDTKQYREFYTTPDVLDAARAGKPVPDGAVIVLAAYMAQLDAAGVPLKDANGRFLKGNLAAVNVQQKKQGFGDDIPAAIRNGDWQYQSFTPDGKVNDKANLTACYQCHLPFAKDEFLTNLAKLKGTFPTRRAAAPRQRPDRRRHRRLRLRARHAQGRAPARQVTWTNADDTPHQVTLVGGDGSAAT